MTGIVNVDLSQPRTLGVGSMLEWCSVCAARHNMLLEGPAAWTEAVLFLLEPHFRAPVAWRRPRARFDVPTDGCGALVLEDVAALAAGEQARVLAWLDDPSHRTQLVSTTPRALYPLVLRGLFNEALYYRLNVLLLQIDGRYQLGPLGRDANGVATPARPPTEASASPA
ncbi:MAG TPA: hypothetical protein VGY48_00215 [Vicinamibacterales bacterium]|nr:hypothetical protein [Vicinamibacterales bacterium]